MKYEIELGRIRLYFPRALGPEDENGIRISIKPPIPPTFKELIDYFNEQLVKVLNNRLPLYKSKWLGLKKIETVAEVKYDVNFDHICRCGMLNIYADYIVRTNVKEEFTGVVSLENYNQIYKKYAELYNELLGKLREKIPDIILNSIQQW